jgi:hypothetical protein
LNPVSTHPGHTQFTRIPEPAKSTASDRVMLTTAAFDAVYAVSAGSPNKPLMDPVVTIAPPPACCMTGTVARTMRYIPVTLTLRMRDHSPRSVSSTVPARSRPALAWRT